MKASQNGKGKRKPPENECTALVLVRKSDGIQTAQDSGKKRDARRVYRRMNAFLRAYRECNGNIWRSCLVSGVSRDSYYRWINGDKPMYKTFQRKIAKIPTGEQRIDIAEATIDYAAKNGDITAAIFTLKTQGRGRGWAEKTENIQTLDTDSITKLLDAFEKVRNEHPNMTEAERALWIRDFAQSGGVPEDALLRRIRVKELTEGK